LKNEQISKTKEDDSDAEGDASRLRTVYKWCLDWSMALYRGSQKWSIANPPRTKEGDGMRRAKHRPKEVKLNGVMYPIADTTCDCISKGFWVCLKHNKVFPNRTQARIHKESGCHPQYVCQLHGVQPLGKEME